MMAASVAIILVPVGCDGWNSDPSDTPVEIPSPLVPIAGHGSTAAGRTEPLGLMDVQRLAKAVPDLAEPSDLL